MSRRIFYAGTADEAEQHAAPLRALLQIDRLTCDEIHRLAQPGDVCVFYNEFFDRFRDLCRELNRRGCRTVYAIDGILEWRNLWENPPAHPQGGEPCVHTMRPALSQVVACIGQSQARILSHWGNRDRCIVVGIPRLDAFAVDLPPPGMISQPTILIMTAKNPGFTQTQRETTLRSLMELRNYLQARRPDVRVLWRVTAGLDRQLQVTRDDRTLFEQLSESTAVITTPSTAMLEAMLAQRPVALLDFHNRPHYVPAAWTITSREHLENVVPALLTPEESRWQYQQEILHDSLGHVGSATQQLASLLIKLSDAASDVPTIDLLHDYSLEEQRAPGLPSDVANSPAREDVLAENQELRERLRVADARLQEFEQHGILGPALRFRRQLRRWFGNNDLPR